MSGSSEAALAAICFESGYVSAGKAAIFHIYTRYLDACREQARSALGRDTEGLFLY